MSRCFRTMAAGVAFLSLSILPACQSLDLDASLASPKATAPHSFTTDPKPTFDLPPTQVLPTPLSTPTMKPTPQVPQAIAINEQSDIPYMNTQKLDVYWPQSLEAWPIVVILHGGHIKKRSSRGLAIAVAGQGAVVFVPEYQSYEPPPDKIEVGAQEVSCAMKYARVKGPDYGGDPERLIVVGHSAGGAFGALITLADDQFPGDCLINEGSTAPDIFIGLDGAYDILRYIPKANLGGAPSEQWLRISPYTYIPSSPIRNDLSFHLFVGEEIELLQNAQSFRDALLQAGYEVTLEQFPGVDHMWIASGYHANTVWAISKILHQ